MALVLSTALPVRAADAPCAELCVVGSFLYRPVPSVVGMRSILAFNAHSTTVYDLTTIFDWGDGQASTGVTHFHTDVANFAGDELLSLLFHRYAVGDYVASITQDAPAIGFHYVQSFSVSQAPEPSMYALLLAGLGPLGFMARRRKQKVAFASSTHT